MRTDVDLRSRRPASCQTESSKADTSPKNVSSRSRRWQFSGVKIPTISRRNIVLGVVILTLLGISGTLEKARRFVIRRARILGQNRYFTEGWTIIDGEAHQTWLRAQQYYLSELPKIRASAQNFSVHSYFASVRQHITTKKIGWYEIIGFRAKEMAILLEEHARDDYRVEKDKCEMMDFFMRNDFPMPKVYKVWRDKAKAIEELKRDAGKILEGSHFPVFLKSCHLTQGSSKGTIPIKSLDHLRDSWASIERWITYKWQYR
eukprot:jgi/Bigna1/89800/estExt_fgenesh1_pg.C_550138